MYGIVGRALMQQQDFEAALPVLEACHQMGRKINQLSQQLGQKRKLWTEPSAQWLADCRRGLEGK